MSGRIGSVTVINRMIAVRACAAYAAHHDRRPLLAQALIQADSVTPARGSVFDVLEAALVPLGFAVDRFTVGEEPDGPVENLLATRSGTGTHLAFAGHVDVVPAGDGWQDLPSPARCVTGCFSDVARWT